MLGGQALGGSQTPAQLLPTTTLLGTSLANPRSQTTSMVEELLWRIPVAPELPQTVVPAPFASKLMELKRDRFALKGKAERVARSIAAIETPQPTRLSASEWKQIAEADIEDQF